MNSAPQASVTPPTCFAFHYYHAYPLMLYTQFQIPIPWLHILISPAVWAIIIAHFCDNWGFSTLLTCMPTYFKQAMPSLQIGGRTDVRIP